MKCKHEQFESFTKVARLTNEDGGEVTGFSLDLKVKCVQCNEFFEFIGVANGYSQNQPLASIDFTELRIPIRPNTGAFGTNMSFDFNKPESTKKENLN
jgi:hypothetical protein